MKLVVFLHILLEGIIGILFLVYPGAPDLVPGFAAGSGSSFQLLLHMYGLAVLFLAAVGILLLIRLQEAKYEQAVVLLGLLCFFHLGMAIIQMRENPDTRAALLHFVLLILLGGVIGRIRRGETA